MAGGDGSFASAFEERFRGSPEEVTRRLQAYLPLLDVAGVRDSGGPVLDLGCGRGEWLALLAENGYEAKGLELSEAAVSRCRENGLDVVQGDAFEYLRTAPDGAFGCITMFHVVEHLPAGDLATLLREIRRALLPGGLAIIETPNPENHNVTAFSFYLDVTHVRPIPPELLRFLGEQAGFPCAWIARLNADTLGAPLQTVLLEGPSSLEVNAAVFAINQMLYVAPDYALIAQNGGGAGDLAASEELKTLVGVGPGDLGLFREAQAEAKARGAEALARARAEEAREAEARAADMEKQARAANERVLAVQNSLSWRITSPVRWAGSTARQGRGVLGHELRAHRSVKTYGKLAVGHPMRWLLAQPGIGAAVDRRLAVMPRLDQKIRIAIHEADVARLRDSAGVAPAVPEDLRPLTMKGREAFEDLQSMVHTEAE
jgi:SAM-dependent methyltransferase